MAVMTVASLEDLGKVIAKIRKKTKGVSQVDLAEKIGRSSVHISNIENGRDISTADIKEIAKALGIQINFIVSLEENDMRRLLDADL